MRFPGNLHADEHEIGNECSREREGRKRERERRRKRERERERGTGLSLAMKITDNRNYSDTHGPLRARDGALGSVSRTCIQVRHA